MKLKQHPDDFQVEELTDVTPGGDGPFAFYRLEKSGWTTPDAVAALRRRWKIDHRRVSYGGLKDRHAHTIQYLTVFHGPRRNLTHHAVRVQFLGQVWEPFDSRSIRANRFRIVLRDMKTEATENAQEALEEVRCDGVPNYFDDQRFGSVGAGEFVARLMVQGRYEDALRLALTGPYEYDRSESKKEKASLQRHWGNWPTCKSELPRSHARSLVDYLVSHPTDFRGALARLRPELRGLYLSAYQSDLWNRMLARWLVEHCRKEQLSMLHLRLGEVPVHHALDENQRELLAALRLPLPNARVALEQTDPRRTLMDAVLADDGINAEQLKLKGFKEMFFSKGDRAGLCTPNELRAERDADDKHPGRLKLTLSFDLPRGCYATMVVKRVTAVRVP